MRGSLRQLDGLEVDGTVRTGLVTAQARDPGVDDLVVVEEEIADLVDDDLGGLVVERLALLLVGLRASLVQQLVDIWVAVPLGVVRTFAAMLCFVESEGVQV